MSEKDSHWPPVVVDGGNQSWFRAWKTVLSVITKETMSFCSRHLSENLIQLDLPSLIVIYLLI